MTASITIQRDVEPGPELEKPRGGLLDVATVRDLADGWGQNTFESYGCMDLEVIPEHCGGPTAEKATYGPTWPEGVRFTAYGMLNCGLLGGWSRAAEFGDAPRKAWDLAETQAVEKGFMEIVLETLGAETIGTVQPIKRAIAMLEWWGRTHYKGVPTIHLPVQLAAAGFEDGYLAWDGENGRARTALGSKVVIGAGYGDTESPAGAAPAAGQSWAYVTGEVLVERIGPLTFAPVPHITKNQGYVLTEQTYAITVDCMAAGLPVYNFGATS